MRLKLLAIAREPKRDLLHDAAEDYLTRARGLAPGLGFKGPEAQFVAPGKGGDPMGEAERLGKVLTGQAVLLDERGTHMRSEDIAAFMARMRDEGCGELAFCIGGADGFDPEFRRRVQAKGGRLLAFGKAVWPYALCRTMLAEQIYRGLAILANHPYHRGDP